jgi:alternate signal-mediated exported protein
MNKLSKGAIAGAAGIALLLGGGGTFALWSSSQMIVAGPVTSGELSIDPIVGATWRDISPDLVDGPRVIPSEKIGSYRIVPGDTLEAVQTITINATGDNLRANLSVVPQGMLNNADTALRDALDYAVSITANGVPVTPNADGSFPVRPAEGKTTFEFTLTLSLPRDEVTGTTAQNSTLDLGAIEFLLAQVR